MGIDVRRTLLHEAAYSVETWPPLSECTHLTTLRYIASTTSSFLTRSPHLQAILLSQSKNQGD